MSLLLLFLVAVTPAVPTPLTDAHKRDIACVVEVAVQAEYQRRGTGQGQDVRESGKRWAGIVGARIVRESGQPLELVAFAMNEAAKERAGMIVGLERANACIRQMNAELAAIDAANAPLPKPVRSQ